MKCHPTAVIFFVGWGLTLHQKAANESIEKHASQRLMENVHMQGFRNPEE